MSAMSTQHAQASLVKLAQTVTLVKSRVSQSRLARSAMCLESVKMVTCLAYIQRIPMMNASHYARPLKIVSGFLRYDIL